MWTEDLMAEKPLFERLRDLCQGHRGIHRVHVPLSPDELRDLVATLAERKRLVDLANLRGSEIVALRDTLERIVLADGNHAAQGPSAQTRLAAAALERPV